MNIFVEIFLFLFLFQQYTMQSRSPDTFDFIECFTTTFLCAHSWPITGHKFDEYQGLILFRVKWEDYPESESTWEPSTNIYHTELIDNYISTLTKYLISVLDVLYFYIKACYPGLTFLS